MVEYLNFISVDFWHIFVSMANLLILYLIMRRFLFAPISAVLEEREGQVKKTYAEAETALEDARRNKAEYDEKISGAEREREDIIRSATEKASRQSDSIISKANEDARASMRRLESDIKLKRRKSVEELRSDITGLVVELAEKVVNREITAEAHGELIDSAIDKLCER